MEATSSDSGRGPSLPWSYRGDQIRSNNPYDNSVTSSSSGTIVSTAYTSSSGSRLSSISMDAVRHFELALDEDTELVRPAKKSCKGSERMKYMDIKSIIREFFGVPSVDLSSNINSNSGDMSVLERWFSELGVAWVLHLPADGASAGKLDEHTSAVSWIYGLCRILQIICGSKVFVRGSLGQVTDSDKQASDVLDQIRLALFTKEAMSKMLPFVDIAIAQVIVSNNEKKLHTVLAMYKVLSNALYRIRWLFFPHYEEVEACVGEIVRLLSAKQGEAREAIWNTMEHVRTRVLESIDIEIDSSSSSLISQASSGIHKAILSAMEYIIFLRCYEESLYESVFKAVGLGKHVPQIRPEKRLDSMIMDTKSCLQEKLVKMSESFPDQGLGFLFLLNNLEFIRQGPMEDDLYCFLFQLYEDDKDLSEKVEVYMEKYLQACWEPVLTCLFSPTPLCFGINHSPLLKFESEFKKAYATQKLRKVPDPKLRERLRTAITNKIVPRYTEYIEENNITTPGIGPQDLEEMLQELFEG